MAFYTGQALLKKLVQNTRHMEMIFIGEMPHHHQKIHNTITDLVLHWGCNSDFKTYAVESLYSLHPFLQQQNTSDNRFGFIDSRIYNYNSEAESSMKINITAIDMAHSIKHSPKLVKDYLDFLLHPIADKEMQNKLHLNIKKLVEYKDKKDKQAGIKKMRRIIQDNMKIFSKNLYEELNFYTDMLLAALEVVDLKTEKDNNLRNRWFIKTIKKALQRKCDSKHKMICSVGAPHAYKEYINENDWYVGQTPEAKHFNDSVYVNKVYSIFIHPYQFEQDNFKWQDPIEDIVIKKFGTTTTVFVDFREYQQKHNCKEIDMYYKNGKFQFDGMILVGDNQETLGS